MNLERSPWLCQEVLARDTSSSPSVSWAQAATVSIRPSRLGDWRVPRSDDDQRCYTTPITTSRITRYAHLTAHHPHTPCSRASRGYMGQACHDTSRIPAARIFSYTQAGSRGRLCQRGSWSGRRWWRSGSSGEVEGRGGVVEGRGDVVAAADVEGELDSGVDLGLVRFGEVVGAAPGGVQDTAGVDGGRGEGAARRLPARSCKQRLTKGNRR